MKKWKKLLGKGFIVCCLLVGGIAIGENAQAEENIGFDVVTNTGEIYAFDDINVEQIPSEVPAVAGELPEPRTIFGSDNRIKVGNTTSYPYSTIVYLSITFPNGARTQGSGSMIAEDVVLTAGHCVYSKKYGGWAKSIEVIPGYNGSTAPFGKAYGTKFSTTSGWANSDGKYSNEHDIGSIKLNTKIGKKTGYLGLNSSVTTSTNVTLTGFHGDKNGVMYTQSGTVSSIADTFLYHRLDSTPGSSGSPMYTNSRQVVAVNAGENSSNNFAPRLSGNKYYLAYCWRYGLDASKKTGINYEAHSQDLGWTKNKANGETAGSTGKALQMEAITISLNGYSGGVQYRTHLASTGWTGWTSNTGISGTVGQKRRMEAIQIKLTGAIANTHHIEYRAHVKDKGWLPWVRNGQSAGTTGEARRMEAIQIRLIKK